MNKSFLSLILAVAGWAVFHFGLFPIFKPAEPGMIVNRYVFAEVAQGHDALLTATGMARHSFQTRVGGVSDRANTNPHKQ